MVVLDKPNYRDSAQGQGSNDRKQRLRQRFEVVKKLGQGTYGKVQLAINKETRQEVAIKTIKKAKIETEQDMVRIRREIQIMSSIRHPYIIHIYEVFENHEKIVLITQYASGGELYDYLGCHKILSENEARRVFRQVASAIYYCHKNKICHRDLKLENILLDDKGNAKIADFGLSNVFHEKCKLKTFCGSPLYASPEIVKGLPYCGPEVDCWSLGVLLYTLVYGAMPFDGSNFKRLVKQISEGDYEEPKNKSGASGLIRRLLTVDASRRATINDICTDWWVNMGYDNSLLKVADDLASLTPVRQDLLEALSSMTPHALQNPAQIRTRNSSKPTNEYDIKQRISGHVKSGTDSSQFEYLKQIPSNANSSQHVGMSSHPNSGNKVVSDFNHYGEKPSNKNIASNLQTATENCIKPQNCEKTEGEILMAVKALIKDIISKVESNRFDAITAEMCINDKNDKPDCIKSLKVNEIAAQDTNCIGIRKSQIRSETMQKEIPSIASKPQNKEGLDRRQGNSVKSDIYTASQSSQVYMRQEFTSKVSLTDKSSISVASEKNIKTKDIHNLPNSGDIFTNPQKNCLNEKSLDSNGRNAKIQSLAFVVPIFEVTSTIPPRQTIHTKPHLKVTRSLDDSFVNQENDFKTSCTSRRFTVPLLLKEENVEHQYLETPIQDLSMKEESNIPEIHTNEINTSSILNNTKTDQTIDPQCHAEFKEIIERNDDNSQSNAPEVPPRKRNLVRIPKSLKLRKKLELSSDIFESKDNAHLLLSGDNNDANENFTKIISNTETNFQESIATDCTRGIFGGNTFSENSGMGQKESQNKLFGEKQNSEESPSTIKQNKIESESNNPSEVETRAHTDVSKSNSFSFKQKHDHLPNNGPLIKETEFISEVEDKTHKALLPNEGHSKELTISLKNDNSVYEGKTNPIDVEVRYSTTELTRVSRIKTKPDEQEMTTSTKSKRRSLSRTRALSMEFESLAEMPKKVSGPQRKPPGKVEIPKYFDPDTMPSPKAMERKEIIFIPTSSVSENKEKIEKKIEKVKQSILVLRPRRKSDASVVGKKKKYVRSQTDFLPRDGTTVDSNLDDMIDYNENLTESELSETRSHINALNNFENLSYCTDPDLWQSTNSLDSDSEECGKRLSPTEEREINFENQRRIENKQNRILSQRNTQHRHSVDTESGYWTPPDVLSESKTNTKQMQITERYNSQSNCYDNIQSSRTAFKNSKQRMKLSDEGLDMCSLSSSMDSGIHSWKQEEINLKRLSPDNESANKSLTPVKHSQATPGNTYAPILRSCKKIVFQPEKLCINESEKEIELAEEKNTKKVSSEHVYPRYEVSNLDINCIKNLKAIDLSESQCSSGSIDASDEVFENWIEKSVTNYSNVTCKPDEGTNFNRSDDISKTSKNMKQREFFSSYSTDKESSDNDDDLDMMMDEYHPMVYGTDGLWQFLKSGDKDPSQYLKKSKSSKPLCQRSKSQETKDSKYTNSNSKITRSLSKEEKEKAFETSLHHYTSTGQLHRKGSNDCLLDDWSFEDEGNHENDIQPRRCNLDDITRWERQFMGSTSSLSAAKSSESISLYGTLGRSKQYQSLSSLNSPSTVRRKSLNKKDSEERDIPGSVCNLNTDDEFEFQNSSDIHRKLSLYGTLRTRNLNLQNRTHSQIVLNTDDGYHILYNDKTKYIDPYSKTSALSDTDISSRNNITKNEFRKTLKNPSLYNSLDSQEKYTTHDKFSHQSGNSSKNAMIKRRVSFSSDIKNIGKTHYSSPMHLHSMNKLREANEQLKSSPTPTAYSRDDDSDSGSLLEALKEHGYKGLISQRIQSNYMHSDIRSNMRISDSLDVDWPSVSSLDRADYYLSQRPYQKQMFFSPTENLEHYSLNQLQRFPIPEENSEFKYGLIADRLNKYTLKGINENNQMYKYPDMTESPNAESFTEHANTSQDIVDCNPISDNNLETTEGHRKSDPGKTSSEKLDKILLHKEFSKMPKTEKNYTTDQDADTEAVESLTDPETKSENLMELLSEKIQALKFRCQRNSRDELRLQKELMKSNKFSTEASRCTDDTHESETLEDNFVERILDTAASRRNSGESVSDRIWRKSFYSRFNDTAKIQRRKSSFQDYEIPPDFKSLKRLGNSNLDEDLQFRPSLTQNETIYNKSPSRNDFLFNTTELLKGKRKEMTSVQRESKTHSFKTEDFNNGKMLSPDIPSEKLSQNKSSLELINGNSLCNDVKFSTAPCEISQNIPEACGTTTVEFGARIDNENEYQGSLQPESLSVKKKSIHVPLSVKNHHSSNSDVKKGITDKDHGINGT